MAKKVLVLTLLASLIMAGSALAELSKTAPMVNHKQTNGEEVINVDNVIPYNPGLATTSPGTIVGYSFYDYQSNGASGNRICNLANGYKYFAWMNCLGWPYPPAPRYVYQNYVDPQGVWYSTEEGSQVSQNSGSGYNSMALYEGDRELIFYHNNNNNYISIEWDPPGSGFFDHYQVPNQLYPQTPDSPGICSWPTGAVDNQNFIHVVACENTTQRLQRLGYTRSEDGGATWSTFTLIDTVMVIGAVMAASPVSDRVVMAYSKTTDTTTQWKNDIVYYVADDGTSWNWRYGRNNVTNYGIGGDTLWAYTDLDVLIDYNDDIQLIWNAQWVSEEGIYFKTFIEHYSEATDEINTVTYHPDSLWVSELEGAWNRPVSKMSLGCKQPGVLYATWTQFDTSDVSAGGYGNGDIYATASFDGGYSWDEPVNVTNSHTPGCFPGECDNDHWSTLAERVDDSLHIFYVNDKDAGGIPQEEGAATENPLMYLTLSSDIFSGIDDVENLPTNFNLHQNYPNPFNASTSISFSLKEAGNVNINIYDITGAKVKTLVDEFMAAGEHQVNWNAADVASGVYYYKLTANGVSESKQAVLIK